MEALRAFLAAARGDEASDLVGTRFSPRMDVGACDRAAVGDFVDEREDRRARIEDARGRERHAERVLDELAQAQRGERVTAEADEAELGWRVRDILDAQAERDRDRRAKARGEIVTLDLR